MKVIILDTETTGLDPKHGHRITEIGAIEMDSMRLTGRHYHQYINPERDVPAKATEITGLTEEFLRPFPVFGQIVGDFLEFIGDAPLVIHNAAFDMKFLNAELEWAQKPVMPMTRAIDTLLIARKKFPGSPASLDALCKRFEIDLAKRDKHGALLDAQLLCEVYIELLGGRQKTLFSNQADEVKNLLKSQYATVPSESADVIKRVVDFPSRTFTVPAKEAEEHQKFVATIEDALWNAYEAYAHDTSETRGRVKG